ncbi:glutamine synthetase [candidate division NPL-UPA2 bacterium Unc8]|uniref:Glutamine synthetase n=1 Tax=candidate division NPL-UPA2 bacterium Unc8 TaxID=1980939 RepID=A0A399G092_UNCN2|nr:MAG: glutamine synthetase [candidate division NPL-UPA2 bacterium Unc8]
MFPGGIKMKKDRDYVLKTVNEKDIKFIKLLFTDVLGFLKSFDITAGELEAALENGIGFDGSSIEGFARIEESDMVALPDPSTFRIIPWQSGGRKVAMMFSDILEPDGGVFEGDPRYILKKNLARAEERGFTYHIGPELEYFYFSNSQEAKALDQGGYFDLTPPDIARDFRHETVAVLEEMEIPVEYSHHEVSPSQHEIDLRYDAALQMADKAMLYRFVVKEVALQKGIYATFMPKPSYGVNGSGMHVHQSLFKGKNNAFFDPDDKYHLSKTGKCFLAGLLVHAREITLITNQWVNSYKRLILGYEAPVYVSWAQRNRSSLVRVPGYRPGKEESMRLEMRSPDPACNPYLTFTVMLAAGLEGIEKNYKLPPPITNNIFSMTEEDREKAGIVSLPDDLSEAIKITEKSPLVRNALGDKIFDYFIKNKKMEWEEYRSQVTEYELKKYLPLL